MKICKECHKLETDPINNRARQFNYAGLDESNTPQWICEVCNLDKAIAEIDDTETADWVDGDDPVADLANLFGDKGGDADDWQKIIDEPYG